MEPIAAATLRGEVTWRPSAELLEHARMREFMRFVNTRHGLKLETYRDLWQWSVTELSTFWEDLASFFNVIGEGLGQPALTREQMPDAEWFPTARLSFAENVLRWARDDSHADRVAILSVEESGEQSSINWRELEAQVAGLAATFREWGIEPGDRIAAVLPNIAEAIVGLLATASVGAIWTINSPDLAPTATLARLQQLEPKVLIVTDGYRYNGKELRLDDQTTTLRAGLSSLERVITVRNLDRAAEAPAGTASFDELTAHEAEPNYARVPFAHPLWVLFSSGTTGAPKGIVHGHGGMLLEALKATGLHQNLSPSDRYYVAASTSWMVWNTLVNTMTSGASVVVYSGSPTLGRVDKQFAILAETGASMFATGAAYLSLVERSDLTPSAEWDLRRLHTILSTGSPLPNSTWRWVHEAVSREVHLGSDSGGTDICSGFIGSNPLEPVHLGELQGPMLAVAAEARNEQGERVIDEVGELVITRPMPSMPLFFWGDDDGERYRSTYFEQEPDVWHHGDWVTELTDGGYQVHGRSDATLNRGGVRLGTADIYAAVQDLAEVEQSLVIGVERPGGEYYLPMFVALAEGVTLDDELRTRIVQRIRSMASARHVPDEIIAVPAVPLTHSGKRVEVAVKRLYMGLPLERSVQLDALANPESIEWFAHDAARLQ